jgi:membrane associated rhomboid family serine protease
MRKGGGGASGETVHGTGLDGAPDGAALHNPIAALGISAVLALVFAAQWWLNAVGEDGSGYAVYLVGGLHAPSVGEWEVFRIFTAPLLHLHPYHLMATLAAVLSLSATLEAQVGHSRILLIVVLSMLAGSIAAVAVPPEAGVLVGASGGAFGAIGAWAALALRHWRSPPPLLQRTRWLLPIVLLGDTALALVAPERVAWIAHLGGFAGGMATMTLVSRGAGPIPLGRSPRWMRLAAACLAALFLWAVVVDVQRVFSGRICEVILRDDLSEAVRDGFTAALRELSVTCANLEPEAPPATPADNETPERPRTRSSANRRGP